MRPGLPSSTFTRSSLRIDPPAVAAEIERGIERMVHRVLRRRGLVIGLSGGVDSSVVAALATRALGRDRVLGILMPERDSSTESVRLATQLAERLGIETLVEDITSTLEAVGCYRRQRDAVRAVFPEFEESWRYKLVLPSILNRSRLNVFQLVVERPDGSTLMSRMSHSAYQQLVAATNFKQRTRMMLEYYHAERMTYGVAGTPNRLEYDQGFFVKHGDGAADIKPIAHLYKSQVYQLAEYLEVPNEICTRAPTTDTYSLPQSQEEFYFSLPLEQMDVCLYAYTHGIDANSIAADLGLTSEQVTRVYFDIATKRRTTRLLHSAALLLKPVKEVAGPRSPAMES